MLHVVTFVTFLYTINLFITTDNIQKKFLLFVTNLIFLLIIATYYQLDGLVLIFTISELAILLVFLVVLSQAFTLDKVKKNTNTLVFTGLLMLNYNFYDLHTLNYKNYYSQSNIVFNDFFYIYGSFFETFILLTLLVLLIITLYSVFFILLFYQLKTYSSIEAQKLKNLYLLRKQNIQRQANFTPKIRVFKTNN